MGTPFKDVYDSFLSKVLDDEYCQWTVEEIECDMQKLLESALPWFKFPRVPLDKDENGLKNEKNFYFLVFCPLIGRNSNHSNLYEM